MKNAICTMLLSAILLLPSCGGRSANPISVREVGDSKMDCEDIAAEMAELDSRARRLMSEQENKTGENVAWGVAGLILLPLALGMDLSDAERQEAMAMQDRYRHLDRIYRKKDCEEF